MLGLRSPLVVIERARNSTVRHEQIKATSSYQFVNAPSELTREIADRAVFHSATAAPDVPQVVGKMIIGSFVALLATFAVMIAHSREAMFAIAVCAVFLFMFFAVPTIFLRVEPKHGKQPDFDTFIWKGIDTFTGHVSGRDALAQILIVPVLLTMTALIMGSIALAHL
jgi:hypothetical protein